MSIAVAAAAPRQRARGTHSGALIGLSVVLILIGVAFLAPSLAPYNPTTIAGRPIEPPSPRHLLGTNDLGQDLLSELIYSARTSLLVGFASALLSTALSAFMGMASVVAVRVQIPLMAIIDLFLAIPHFPVLVLIIALLGPGMWHLILALTLLGWPAYARVVRSQILVTVQRDFVEAARALGASEARIVVRYLLPEVLPLLWTKFLLTVRWAVLMEAALALLGLGDPAAQSWGMMLDRAFVYPLLFLQQAWLWWALPPALAIVAITLALSAIGQDFEAWLNPASLQTRR